MTGVLLISALLIGRLLAVQASANLLPGGRLPAAHGGAGADRRRVPAHREAAAGLLADRGGPGLHGTSAGGPPKPVATGSDGIAISADGSRLYYCPLASRRWYSVSADALADRSVTDEDVAATVVDEGDKGATASRPTTPAGST
jgi:hypothetical protein